MKTRKLFNSVSVGDIIIPQHLDTWVGTSGIKDKFSEDIDSPLRDFENVKGVPHKIVHKDMLDNQYHRVVGRNKNNLKLYCFSMYNEGNEYGVEYISGVSINDNNKTLLLLS